MREILTSPAATAVAAGLVILLGALAIRGIWRPPPREKEPPHLYIRLRAAQQKGKKRP